MALRPYQMLAQLTPGEKAQQYDPNNTGFDVQFRRAMALKGPQVLPRVMPSASASHVPVSAYPWLVTFSDIKDPTSVKAVDPDNLAASFGPGYKLRSIVLEKSDDLPVSSIKKKLGEGFFDRWDQARQAALKNTINDPYFKSLAGQLNGDGFTTNGKFQ